MRSGQRSLNGAYTHLASDQLYRGVSLRQVSFAPVLCTDGRMITLALALALQTASPPQPQTVPMTAVLCVMAAGERLERTGESATMIADAAIIACDREIDALENESAVDYQRRYGGSAAAANELGLEARASFETMMRRNTVERVMAVRSGRSAPGG